MKNSLLFLLLLNLLVWGWYSWVGNDSVPASGYSSAPNVANNRVGLPETGAASGNDVEPAPEPTPDVARAVRLPGQADPDQAAKNIEPVCNRVGPFAEESEADALSTSLESRGLTVRKSAGVDDIWMGHWVKVTGFDDRAAAGKSIQRLKAGGLSDLYAMESDGRWEVSLGLFRKKDSADRVLATALKAGEPAIMVDRTKAQNVYFLSVKSSVGSDVSADGLWGGAGSEKKACDSLFEQD